MNMMHPSADHQRLDAVPRQLRLQGARRFEPARAGWLAVQQGRVWLTRDGGGGDHVLQAGGRIWLGRGERVLVEPWRAGDVAVLAWQLHHGATAVDQPAPRARRAVRGAGEAAAGVGSGAWRALALALRALAAGLLAAARSADARASRPQGAMPAGESIASSGALQ